MYHIIKRATFNCKFTECVMKDNLVKHSMPKRRKLSFSIILPI